MPNYVALEWGRAGIRGLAAEVSGDAVQVRGSFVHDWPQDFDAARDAESTGRWLKSRIEELDGEDFRLLVLVSREDVTMRLLTLPAAGEETVPELVRYQTRVRSSVPLEQLAWDYLPLTSAPSQGGRWVQSATVPDRLVQHIKACADVAGLDLRAVGMTTVAVGETIVRAERLREPTGDHKTLVVRAVGEQVEIAVWRDTDLLFGHVARAGDSKAIGVEVERALLSHQTVIGDGIDVAWIIAADDCGAELKAMFASRFGCDVTLFDPSNDLPNVRAGDLDGASFVAALGALLASLQPVVPTIDFLKPRRRLEKRNPTKVVAAVVVGLLLLLMPAGYLASRYHLKSLDRRISEQERIVQQRDQELKQGESSRVAVAFLNAWDKQRIDWLDQMHRINAEMPGTEHLYLDRWRFDRAGGNAPGTTEAIGFARQRQDAQRVTQRLAEQEGFRIRPNSIGSAGSDSDYPVLFQLNAELVPPGQPTGGKASE